MSQHDNEDFDGIAARLEAARPRLDGRELDDLMLRCRPRKASAKRRKGDLMRSRLAITAMLIMGFALSSTGVGLAVSGTSGSGSAGNAQYPTTTQTQPEQGGGVLGANEQNQPVQATKQLSTPSGSQLPFTGYAVIPVLLLGAGLLVTGLVLRRRSKDSPGA